MVLLLADMTEEKKSKLGMGLQGLLGMQKFGASEGNSVVEIEIADINVAVNQPRKHIDQDELMSLAESIKSYGILQPIIVQKIGDGYEIIAGERRFRAAKYANLAKIPCIIKNAEEIDPFTIAMIENIQRSNLNVIDEADGYSFLQNSLSLSQNEIAIKIGKSRSHVANMLRVANLTEELKAKIRENNVPYSHIKIIASHPKINDLVSFCIQKQPTVRELENVVQKLNSGENIDKNQQDHSENKISEEMRAKLKNLSRIMSKSLKMRVNLGFNAKRDKLRLVISSKNIDELLSFVENSVANPHTLPLDSYFPHITK